MHAMLKLWLSVQFTVLVLGCSAAPPAQPVRVADAATAGASTRPATTLDASLLQRGYYPRTVNGELKYCRKESVTGSLFSSTICLTPDDIRARENNAQQSVDMAHRGDGGCRTTPCP